MDTTKMCILLAASCVLLFPEISGVPLRATRSTGERDGRSFHISFVSPHANGNNNSVTVQVPRCEEVKNDLSHSTYEIRVPNFDTLADQFKCICVYDNPLCKSTEEPKTINVNQTSMWIENFAVKSFQLCILTGKKVCRK